MSAASQTSVNRRAFVQGAAAIAAGIASANWAGQAGLVLAQAPAPLVELPKLPYAYDALEPHIDAKTMMIHHTKHHQAYIDRFAGVLKDHPDLAAKKPEDLLKNLAALPDAVRAIVQNHGGGHVNHTLFWNTMGPGKGCEPQG